MDVRAAQKCIAQRLAGIADRQEQRFLLETLLQTSWAHLLAHPETPLSEERQQTLHRWLEERAAGTPIQYVLGEWVFMGLPLTVRADVLIPRDDTETLARAALELAQTAGLQNALDLCCGSGCVGIALAVHGDLDVTFADLSDAAIALTRENAARHGIAAPVCQGDLFAAIDPNERFDLIVCNPPYIRSGDIAALDPIVREREPHLALDGGADGLAFYRRLADEAPPFLRMGGFVALEIGYDQGRDVWELFSGWHDRRITQDINGNDRVFTARLV